MVDIAHNCSLVSGVTPVSVHCSFADLPHTATHFMLYQPLVCGATLHAAHPQIAFLGGHA